MSIKLNGILAMKKYIEKIKKIIQFRYSPLIPEVDLLDKESRKEWMLYMAQETGRFPVREIYDKFIPHVTKVTLNNDLQQLESAKLIKREKDHLNRSYVIPIQIKPKPKKPTKVEVRRKIILNYGLPSISIIMLAIYVALLLA